jgi:hypothetical protein
MERRTERREFEQGRESWGSLLGQLLTNLIALARHELELIAQIIRTESYAVLGGLFIVAVGALLIQGAFLAYGAALAAALAPRWGLGGSVALAATALAVIGGVGVYAGARYVRRSGAALLSQLRSREKGQHD